MNTASANILPATLPLELQDEILCFAVEGAVVGDKSKESKQQRYSKLVDYMLVCRHWDAYVQRLIYRSVVYRDWNTLYDSEQVKHVLPDVMGKQLSYYLFGGDENLSSSPEALTTSISTHHTTPRFNPTKLVRQLCVIHQNFQAHPSDLRIRNCKLITERTLGECTNLTGLAYWADCAEFYDVSTRLIAGLENLTYLSLEINHFIELLENCTPTANGVTRVPLAWQANLSHLELILWDEEYFWKNRHTELHRLHIFPNLRYISIPDIDFVEEFLRVAPTILSFCPQHVFRLLVARLQSGLSEDGFMVERTSARFSEKDIPADLDKRIMVLLNPPSDDQLLGPIRGDKRFWSAFD